ncbi:DnaJ homolog subfamily C member 7 homolog [Durusdinium trenchii]|uniref:DnaJ homolog subfamily C member 7 homolog n=1 Tax=Durusdinium trenchii TaxID=1381693 RepID=A0ABP0NGH5_9DINO
MHLARQDALAPYSGGGSRPRSRGYVTVREPAKGFFIAGSSVDDMNGIYAAARAEGLGLRRKTQIAYRNDSSGWIMALMKAPPEPKKSRLKRRLDRSRLPAGVLSDSSSDSDDYSERFEWTFVDPLGRERFAHKGDTIIPGAGLRWWHLHREHVSHQKLGEVKSLPQLYWHECLEDDADFETADENEDDDKPRISQEPPASEMNAIMEPVKDDEDELPWQVIAVLDHSVIRDLRYSYRRYERTVAAARAGANLPKPGPHSLEFCCQQPRCWIYRVVAPAGAVVRAHPRPFAKSCGQLDLGQYVCGVERDGAWLRLARADEADDDDAQWVCVHRDGKPLLEAVRDSDMGSATAPPEDPLADKFDRPFEPRLQAPDFQAPEEGETEAKVDIRAFEDQEEGAGSRSHNKDLLAVGYPCILQGLFDSSKNGKPCTVLKLPAEGGDGRCVVQLSECRSKLAVKLPNLRPLRGAEETEIEYSARVLGLSTPLLGLGKQEDNSLLNSLDPTEVLAAALRSAQRDLPEAPDALLESQQAFDKLASAIKSKTPNGEVYPPHALVEQGLLGRRAAEAAMNAANCQSIKIAESGLSALRQLLNDEHRRQAGEVGLQWPLPSSTLAKLPCEGPDALRLRLTLVRALLRCRQEPQAVLEAEACVRRHPGNAASLLYAGRSLLRVGRREQGLKYLSTALDATSGTDHTWGHQGASIRVQSFAAVERCKLAAEDAYAYGDFATAALRYGDALLSCPTDDKWGRATLHAARAACHRRAREFRQAIDDCDLALNLFPRYARALFRRAACLLEAGRPKEAIKSLETLLRVDRKWPNLCDWLVRAHAQAKRMEKDDRYRPSWKKTDKRGHEGQQRESCDGAPELSGSDLYSILGVSSDATDQQLKRAYRLMSLKYHPDKQGGSTRDFQRIAHAYETLSDPAKRHAYNDGADLKKKEDKEDSESDREEKSLREEVERKYFPERFKYWPFGDPFIEKRKLYERRRKEAEQKTRAKPDRDDW